MNSTVNILSYTQRGVSLIGLMIGLFISMLCILASLSLYKNLIHVTAVNKIDTLFDGQLAAALMVTQMEVLSAGYGIDDADGDDIVISAAGTELIWRYQSTPGNFTCQRLIESTAAGANGINYRTLFIQQATADCDGTVTLTSIPAGSWSSGSPLAMWHLTDELNSYITAKQSILKFILNPLDCAPFGRMNAERHLQLSIIAPSSTTLHSSHTEALTSFDFCLANTYPA